MTIAQLNEIVEPLPDDMVVTWGCADTSIPKKVYRCNDSTISTFKEWLSQCEPWEQNMTEWNGKKVEVRQWLINQEDNTITFYMGYDDDEN